MNIDYGTGSRIYTLGVSGEAADGVAFNVPLIDTQGELVSCNYVDIQAEGDENSDDDNIFVVVELSGVGKSSPSIQVSGATAERFNLGAATAGFTLLAAGTNRGSSSRYQWHGWRQDSVKGLKITATGGNSGRKIDLAITYGTLIPYNKTGDPWVDVIGT